MASVTKRGKYWRAQVRRLGHPPQSKTFDTHAEAEAWARIVESEMDRGIFVSRVEAERTTLAEALKRYKIEICSRKAHPAQEYQRVDRWLREPLAHRYLANLKGVDFAQYRDMRRAAGRAENTIRLELALVSHLFEVARREWGMESLLNPLKNIRKPSGSRERDRRLKAGEYDRIAAALAESENPCAPQAFDLAIETSLRHPGRPAPLVRQRAAWSLRVLRAAAQLAGACRLPAAVAAHLVPLPEAAQQALASGGLGLVRGRDGALRPATRADHSFLGGATHMARVTFGKSRVRESRMLGSVRAKPNGLATRPRAMETAGRSQFRGDGGVELRG